MFNTDRNTTSPAAKVSKAMLLSVVCVLMSGCISAMNTRLPVAWTGHPRSESLAYQQQDPFLSPDIGPVDSTRPRDYARPRTEARQAAEQRLLNGLSTQPESNAPSPPRSGLHRPAAVY